MSWLNYYGLAIMLFLMLPNMVVAARNKEMFENHFDCKALEIAEQIGRYGSFVFTVINVPFPCIGWLFQGAERIYILVNGLLVLAYELVWLIMQKKKNLTKAILLSTIPSAIFIFSGVMIGSLPLLLFSILFAVCHITISVKNAKAVDGAPE